MSDRRRAVLVISVVAISMAAAAVIAAGQPPLHPALDASGRPPSTAPTSTSVVATPLESQSTTPPAEPVATVVPTTTHSTGSRATSTTAVPDPQLSVPFTCTTWIASAHLPVAALGEGHDDVAQPGDIVFVSGPPNASALWLMRPDGAGKRQLTEAGGASFGPDLSPDGRRVLWIHESEITVMELATGQIRRLSPCRAGYAAVKWSPDGQWVAFTQQGRGASGLFFMRADGTDLRPASLAGPSLPLDIHRPDWSPDGRRVVVSSHGDRWGAPDRAGLYVIDVFDGSTTKIFSDRASAPAWSPTGNLIAFSRGDAIAAIAVDGTGVVVDVASGPGARDDPDWAPDGSRLVFSFGDDLQYVDGTKIFRPQPEQPDRDVYTINTDGSDLRNLSNNPAAWDLAPSF